MSVTQEDLQDFNRFAAQRLENGGAESLIKLAGEWEAQRRGSSQGDIAHSDIARSVITLDTETENLLAASFSDEQNKSLVQQALSRRDGVTTAELLRNAARTAEEAS